MGSLFLKDMGRTVIIFAGLYSVTALYLLWKQQPWEKVKDMFMSKYSLGLACVAGIISLALASSLAGIISIGGFFMGLLYFVFSHRP